MQREGIARTTEYTAYGECSPQTCMRTHDSMTLPNGILASGFQIRRE